MEEHIPSRHLTGNKNKKPWISKTTQQKLKRLKRLYSRQKTSKKAKDRQQYVKARSEIQKEQRQEYWRYIEGLIDDTQDMDTTTKQKKFWHYIRSLRKDNCSVSPLKDQGKLHSNPIDKANILNQQYKSVFTREDTANIPKMKGEAFPPMPDITIELPGVI